MPSLPADRSYTAEHEWVMIEPGAELPVTEPVRIGITSVAADALGELVFVELPEVGTKVVAGESCGEVESTKTVSDIFPPVSGTVTILNTAAIDDPGIVSRDPYGEGWLFAVLPTAADTLLTAAEYAQVAGVDS
ncbi:glycine cleavage system protein GcvH [Gordonia westfalica]|uniref:Glycine cleavage system H protein n=1 Tax=Gordonia westfalica TaxID=158898 RepID=A0ABU2GZ61_9ACTN|nr:glycine cleavage system protein GcvH [Gordonia westfalica]MDS1116721.1 glycine cleavage system protein GcvH [Gordonia westfalica]